MNRTWMLVVAVVSLMMTGCSRIIVMGDVDSPIPHRNMAVNAVIEDAEFMFGIIINGTDDEVSVALPYDFILVTEEVKKVKTSDGLRDSLVVKPKFEHGPLISLPPRGNTDKAKIIVQPTKPFFFYTIPIQLIDQNGRASWQTVRYRVNGIKGDAPYGRDWFIKVGK